MKKYIYLLSAFAFMLLSCASAKKFKAYKDNKGNLVGIATKKDLQQAPYGEAWFNDCNKEYQPDKIVLNKLKPLLEGVKIKGFMGTWCSDSRRETPNFCKILDETNFDYKDLELITVNKRKKAKGLEKGYNIERVPTFIFYKDGVEIGRFVEHSVGGESLETDMVKILSKIGYKHPYQK